MGIMPCSRRGCESILCEKYSSKYGYICQNCYNELLDTVIRVDYFLSTPKGYTLSSEKLIEHRKLVREEFGEKE